MSITLRSAEPLDLKTIVEFNRRLALESEGKELDLDLLRPGVRALLEDAAKGFYTIAEINGEVVGQTLITTEWSDWRNGWFWWIQSVYVAESARSSGVFKALFEHLRQQATATVDVIGLRLYVDHGNEKAKTIYRKLGMTGTEYELLEMFPLCAG